MALPYQNRTEAGRLLAAQLRQQQVCPKMSTVVLALPRGGVPVGFEVAGAMNADLDLILVRKLGMPGHEELAMGAIASGDVRVLNENVVGHADVSDEALEQITQRERTELRRREREYRGGREPVKVAGRCVILVDDGLATGSTMLAAVRAVKQQQPGRLVVAVPVAPPETYARFKDQVDQVVCPATPAGFGGVGAWYREFPQTSDEEVRTLLERAWGG